MEQDFYRDEFEQLLKDSTEDFKMYPSRKVWHSIYNDRHPDRKWPSLAVCLLLLTAILYVGVSNNNSINSASRKNYNALARQIQIAEAAVASPSKQDNSPLAKPTQINLAAENLITVPAENASSLPSYNLFLNNTSGQNVVNVATVNQEEDDKVSFSLQTALISATDGKLVISVIPSSPSNSNSFVPSGVENTREFEKSVAASNPEKAAAENLDVATNDMDMKEKEIASLSTLHKTKLLNTKDTREREWIENYAFYNQPAKRKKFLSGFDGEFYLTPGIGYRVMFQNKEYKKINNALIAANSSARYAEPTPLELNQQIGLTMEMGGTISKNISKRLRVKTGLQLNISDYITYAKKLDHPGQTTLALTDINNNVLNFESHATNYANVPGENSSQLHNKTIQVSLPLGADYKLMTAGKLNWHVGASIQPTYVAGGYAYLVSSDNNYFVEDASMLRRWNLNGAVESFLSIKTKEGTRINLGPQFRYSLFSTYNKSYSYTEKPYSIGFKIGFSKSF